MSNLCLHAAQTFKYIQLFYQAQSTCLYCVFVVNPSLNSHDNDSGMGRGFGRGFRGRGAIRPGLGRAEFAHADIAMTTPWMGPGAPIMRAPPPVMPGMIPPPGDKLPPGMAVPGAMVGLILNWTFSMI